MLNGSYIVQVTRISIWISTGGITLAKQEGKKSFPVVKHVLHPWFKIVTVMDVVVGLNKVYVVAISLG